MSDIAKQKKADRRKGDSWCQTMRHSCRDVSNEYREALVKNYVKELVATTPDPLVFTALQNVMKKAVEDSRTSENAIDVVIAQEIRTIGDVSLDFLLGIQDDLTYEYEYPLAWGAVNEAIERKSQD